jgi:hypothetical protein
MIFDENAQLALDTILQEPVNGIPTWIVHIMEHSMIERVAGVASGDYRKDPEKVYLQMQHNAGVCMIDQYIPHNPLDIGEYGYESYEQGATTGLNQIVIDGIPINSPEDVVEHIETKVFPRLKKEAKENLDEEKIIKEFVGGEKRIQDIFGNNILKVPYACIRFPYLDYYSYGYINYFSAYAMYPEVMEKCFSLMADACLPYNRVIARAYKEYKLPPLLRADHDIADSRGILVGIKSLEKLWLPHFARAIEPLLKAGVKVIWHCDGNLMDLVPCLLDVGLVGFQGFQYEDGMDYEKICSMKTKNGDDLIIIGGVSVTRTLPFGTPADVKKEIDWLVTKGPKTGLFLGGSSSMAPGVKWENIKTFIDGLNYYRTHGRK